MNQTVPINYTATGLAKALHGLPHYNIKFQGVSSDFNPTNLGYLESLMQFAIPYFIISALVFLFYLIRFCCCERRLSTQPPPSRAGTIRCRITLLVLLSLLAIGLALFGNEATHSGLNAFQSHVIATNNTVSAMANTVQGFVNSMQNMLNNVDAINASVILNTGNNVTMLRTSLSAGVSDAQSVVANAQTLDISHVNPYISKYEAIRHGVLLGFIIIIAIMCLGLWIGSCRRGRASLLATGLVLVVGILLAGVIGGACFALSVASADFCVDSNGFLTSQFNNAYASYYANCDVSSPSSSPFNNEFLLLDSYINAAVDLAIGIDDKYPDLNLLNQASQVNSSLQLAINAVFCANVHNDYVHAVSDLCDNLLRDIFIEAVALSCLVLFLIILLHYAELGWKTFDEHLGYYLLETYSPDELPEQANRAKKANRLDSFEF